MAAWFNLIRVCHSTLTGASLPDATSFYIIPVDGQAVEEHVPPNLFEYFYFWNLRESYQLLPLPFFDSPGNVQVN